MTRKDNAHSIDALLKLLANADTPFNDDAVSMDCNDNCEEIAELAERVASGEEVGSVLPNFASHLDQIACCREEFEALVNVLRADHTLQVDINGLDAPVEELPGNNAAQ